MRIGLFGLPTAGKTYIMDRIDFLTVLRGGKLLRTIDPDFDKRDESGREKARKAAANYVLSSDNFIMDGHYAFGDEIAFTDEEGEMYDIYIYLYLDPSILKKRLSNSERNKKWLCFDVEAWQENEINGLREYCHCNNKDFYIVDNPPTFDSESTEKIIKFIRDITEGYSCLEFAKECCNHILHNTCQDTVTLLDGDKTLTYEDSSNVVFGYHTHLFDGNFYTGYQAWKQANEFAEYVIPDINEMPVTINHKVLRKLSDASFILTSGNQKVWSYISNELKIPFFCGNQMSAETKLYITKMLQNAGKRVIAYGDGMNDYYMLKQADEGYLITKKDGRISRSLVNKELEGIILV